VGLRSGLNAMMESETVVSFGNRILLFYFEWSVDNKGEEKRLLVKQYWLVTSQRCATLCVFAGERILHVTTSIKSNVM